MDIEDLYYHVKLRLRLEYIPIHGITESDKIFIDENKNIHMIGPEDLIFVIPVKNMTKFERLVLGLD